jgi:Uma2 family endonuclease
MARVNTSPLVKTYTLEEFWELPEPLDHSKLELIAGVLFMTPPPGYTHDTVVKRLIRLLTLYLETSKNKGGLYVPRAAMWTGKHTYLEPDLFYLSSKTEDRFKSKHRTMADLVIEVVSPGSAIYDRNTKADTYAALGVKELWLVDEAAETIEVRNLIGTEFGMQQFFARDERLKSKVLQTLDLEVRLVFED